MRKALFLTALMVGLMLASNDPAQANCHTWDVSEIFSNADGTIQFIELREPNGGCCEDGVPGHRIASNKRTYIIPLPDLALPTAFRRLLFGVSPTCWLGRLSPMRRGVNRSPQAPHR